MPYGYNTPRRITSRQARAIMQTHPGATILDVRSRQEYNAEHIPGAVCLPDNTIEAYAPRVLPNKGALILVYCKGGSRSRGAASTLVEMGYTNVYDFGGIDSWPYERE